MSNKNAWINAPLLLLVFADSSSREPADTLQETPLSVQVVSAEMINDLPQNQRSLEDFLHLVPGVNIGDQTGRPATATLRGIEPSAAVVLVNGRAVGGASVGSFSDIPSNFLDRVEVLQGPQGTLFGTGTRAGVINIVTNDTYTGRDVGASWLLNDVNRALSEYYFSVESNSECDATPGAELPHWTFSDAWNYGQPDFSLDGEVLKWKSEADDYDVSRLYDPVEPLVTPYDPFSPLGGYTYLKLDELVQRIRNDPGTHEEDKRHYIAGLMFGAAFAGPGGLSDQAVGFFHFDPREVFEDFKKFASNRTDADRAAFGSFGYPTVPSTPVEAPVTPAESPAAPVATTAESTPNPFEKYPFPPDYAFDFSLCTDDQKDDLLGLIRERDKARADNSYYMDYLRRDGQSAQDVAADEASAAAALTTRDEKNRELKTKWRECTNPPATSQASADSAEPPAEADAPGFGYRTEYNLTNRWSVELHLEYDKPDESKPPTDIGVDMYRYESKAGFDLPFSVGPKYDTDFDAGSTRTFFNDEGVARIENAVDADLGLSSRLRLQIDVSAETDGGLKFGARVRLPDAQPETEEDDWQYFLDYDLKGLRSGPTIGLKYQYNPVDSVYQEYVPYGGIEQPPLDVPALIQESEEYLAGLKADEFSFGGRSFKTFWAAEAADLDWSALDYVKGQTYWANNECGDTALPPEGGGYLTAEQSPVKSVGDQWALQQVGLSGDEPTLDEFAKPVIVGVIDTGLDWNHRDIAWDNLWRNEDEIPDNKIDDDNNGFVDDVIGWNFTSENNRPWDHDGHGTFVAGIIAATQGNDVGIDGINGSARIMVLKALNNFGRTRATYVAKAIVYGADNGAQILNLSVAGPGFPKIVQDAVDYAESKGVLVVNAAGNRAEDIGQGEYAPLQRVLTVAATGPDDRRAIFSNIGAAVDVAAPGVDIVSLRARATDFMYNSGESSYVKEDAFLGKDRRYYRSAGTSFAAPIVTGIASLVLANNPGLKPAELKRLLEQSARDAETPGRDRFTGFGIVDAKAALAADPAYFIHAAITSVRLLDIDGQTVVEVTGLADADQLESSRLEIGEGENPQSWVAVGLPNVDQVVEGQLGLVPADQLASATSWTIRLLVNHANGSSREARYIIDL